MTAITCQTVQPLTIPDTAFDNDGAAVLVVNGGSYGGGWWRLYVFPGNVPYADREPIGEVEIGPAPKQPGVAIGAADGWLRGECARLGYRLVEVVDRCGDYGPAEAPYFALAAAGVTRS